MYGWDGKMYAFDENTGAVSRTAALGCNPSDFLSRPFKDNLTVEEYIPSLAPEEVTIDTDPDSLSRGGRMIIPLSVGDKIMGGLIVATVLTLLFLPALYAAWFRVKPVAQES
jgi:hypothetical protein